MTSTSGSIALPVQGTDDVMPGVVCIPYGWGHGQPGARQSVAAAHAGVNVNVLTDAAAFLWRAELAGHKREQGLWREVSAYGSKNFPAAGLAFDAVHARAQRAQALAHAVGERLQLPARVAAGDDHALDAVTHAHGRLEDRGEADPPGAGGDVSGCALSPAPRPAAGPAARWLPPRSSDLICTGPPAKSAAAAVQFCGPRRSFVPGISSPPCAQGTQGSGF